MKDKIKELENVGNINHIFKNPVRRVKPIGFLTTPKLVLKQYDMYTEKSSSMSAINSMDRFLLNEIDNNKLDPKLGLGFVILSKDMLNVARWDNKYPIVAFNNLYEFPEKERNNMNPTPLSVDNSGGYCVWELGIVNHERKAWMKYLNSKRTDKDKLKYLNDFLEGRIK